MVDYFPQSKPNEIMQIIIELINEKICLEAREDMLMVSPPFIADFDGDNFVGSSDIEHAVKLLTQNELAMDEIESIWEKVRRGQ